MSKNGREFEDRIQQKERHNPKFSFLNPNDPYHGYYMLKCHELKEGGQEAIARLTAETQNQETMSVMPKSPVIVEAVEEEPERPEDLLFTLDLPMISPLDLYPF